MNMLITLDHLNQMAGVTAITIGRAMARCGACDDANASPERDSRKSAHTKLRKQGARRSDRAPDAAADARDEKNMLASAKAEAKAQAA